MLPRKEISMMIMQILGQKGRTIAEIQTLQKTTSGDKSQREYQDSPIWHTRQSLISDIVANMQIHHSLWGPKRISSDFYNMVDQEVAKIRNKGLLVNWISGGSKRVGVWRLVNLPTPAEPKQIAMTMDERINGNKTAPSFDSTEAGMSKVFYSILTRGKKDNTYKFALAKILLKYCKDKSGTGLRTHKISYRYLAEKFLEYYWYQVCKFRIKQDFKIKSKPKVVSIIEEIFGSDSPSDFKYLDPKDKEKAVSKILKAVFGHARIKTSQVVPRFQKVTVGSSAQETRLFYDYNDDEQQIVIKPLAFEFLKKYNSLLSAVVLVEWTKFLEKINTSLPMLVAKVDNHKPKRTALTPYRNILEQYDCHCFYCSSRLERGLVHVDHFIPWSFLFTDDRWNFVLACQRCNLKKHDSLAEEEFRDMLITRNTGFYDKDVSKFKHSLDLLDKGKGWNFEIKNYYDTCHDYGFLKVKLP